MLRPGHGLFCAAISLLILGVLMVTSASLRIDAEAPLTVAGVLTSRTSMLAAIAVAVLLIAAHLPIGRLADAPRARTAAWLLGTLALILVLLPLVPGLGRSVKGASRWLEFGGLSFQPSEIAKYLCVLLLAWYASRRPQRMESFFAGFLLPSVAVLVLVAAIAITDLGTAVLIAAVAGILLMAAGVRPMHPLPFIPLVLAGVAAAILHPRYRYRLERLETFRDPFADPANAGYQALQSMAAVSGGGPAGRGLGNGIQKFGYLPEDTSDFIFAIICEEQGLVGAAIVCSLFIAIIGCGIAIIARARTAFGRLLTTGVMLTIGFQAVINLLVVTGLAPTKGIALPLVSLGGTGWIVTSFFLGLVIAVDRETHLPTPQDAEAPWDAEEPAGEGPGSRTPLDHAVPA